jgi:hypothetical protein
VELLLDPQTRVIVALKEVLEVEDEVDDGAGPCIEKLYLPIVAGPLTQSPDGIDDLISCLGERTVEEHEVLTPILLPLITLAVALPPLIELLVTLGHLGHRLLHILKGGGAFVEVLCVLTHHPPEA